MRTVELLLSLIMTRLLFLAAITPTVSVGLLFAACSGSSGVTFPDASTTSDSGGVTSGDGGFTDGGNQCAPCEQTNPDPTSCTTTDACGCGPFTCADSGTAEPCTWGPVNTCGAGKYCNAVGCKVKGQCVPVAAGSTETSASVPVCGCDGVTYWNASVAATHGASIWKKGACTGNDALPCSTTPAVACPATTSCNLEAKSLAECMTPVTGTCWGLPTTCPGGAIVGRDAKSCTAATCIGECAAIKGGAPWYTDNCLGAQPGGH